MGAIADELNERSKLDNRIIVGSEIRAAIGELWAEIAKLKAEKEELRADLYMQMADDAPI